MSSRRKQLKGRKWKKFCNRCGKVYEIVDTEKQANNIKAFSCCMNPIHKVKLVLTEAQQEKKKQKKKSRGLQKGYKIRGVLSTKGMGKKFWHETYAQGSSTQEVEASDCKHDNCTMCRKGVCSGVHMFKCGCKKCIKK